MIGNLARIELQARGLALAPLVSALAAGCSAIIKPSKMTPATSALIAQIVAQSFAPDLVAVAEGGVETSTQLLALPFDHIFFTGSPAVGKFVMQAAAKTLASVTLELGGKSPVIFGPDADIAQAARWIAWGRFINAGQTRVAPDHVSVHDSQCAALTHVLQARMAKMYGPDPAASPAMACLLDDRNMARFNALVTEAQETGAAVQAGGYRRADSDANLASSDDTGEKDWRLKDLWPRAADRSIWRSGCGAGPDHFCPASASAGALCLWWHGIGGPGGAGGDVS